MIIGLEEVEKGQNHYNYGIRATSAKAYAYYINMKYLKLSNKIKNMLNVSKESSPKVNLFLLYFGIF